jgi:Protein of unknown function (DUF3987)
MNYHLNPFINLCLDASHKTETPPLLTAMASISGAAAMLGRNVWLPFGNGRLFPNLYVALIGTPGVRKSTAVNTMRKQVQAAGFSLFASEKITMQKFLMDLGGYQLEQSYSGKLEDMSLDNLQVDSNDPERISQSFLAHGEFLDLIGQNNQPFITLLGELWDKDEPYSYRIKGGESLLIPNICVDLLAGATPKGLGLMFPPSISDQGMLSRTILVCARPSGKKFAMPVPTPPELTAKIVSNYRRLRDLHGSMTMTSEATVLNEKIYKSWAGFKDPRLEGYGARRQMQLLKISMIFAAMRDSLSIVATDMMQAHTFLSYVEMLMPAALGGYGSGRYADVTHKVLLAVRQATKPITILELIRMFMSDVDKPAHVQEILSGLHSTNQIQLAPDSKGVMGYLAVQSSNSLIDIKYVDWKLMRGIANEGELL